MRHFKIDLFFKTAIETLFCEQELNITMLLWGTQEVPQHHTAKLSKINTQKCNFNLKVFYICPLSKEKGYKNTLKTQFPLVQAARWRSG